MWLWGVSWRESNKRIRRRGAWDAKFKEVAGLRRCMTDADLEDEEARLVEEVAALAAARGLSGDNIGQGWGRPPAIDGLRSKGTGEC